MKKILILTMIFGIISLNLLINIAQAEPVTVNVTNNNTNNNSNYNDNSTAYPQGGSGSGYGPNIAIIPYGSRVCDPTTKYGSNNCYDMSNSNPYPYYGYPYGYVQPSNNYYTTLGTAGPLTYKPAISTW